MYVCKYSAAPAHARTRAHRPVYGCQSGSRGKGGLYRTVIGACAFGPEPEEGRRLCACVVGLFCVNPKPIYESQSGSRGDLHRTGPGLVRLLACEGGGGLRFCVCGVGLFWVNHTLIYGCQSGSRGRDVFIWYWDWCVCFQPRARRGRGSGSVLWCQGYSLG